MERGKVTNNTSHHHHHHHNHTYINPNSPPTTTTLQHNNTSFPTHLPHHHSNSTLTIFNAQNYFNQVTTTTTTNSNTRVSPVVANMNSQQHKKNNNEEVARKKTTTTSSPPSSLHGCAITRNFIPHSLFQAATTKAATNTTETEEANRNNRFNNLTKRKPENRASHCLYTKPTWLLRKCPCFCKRSVQVKQPATPTPNPKTKTAITKIPSKSQLQPPEQKITNIEKAVTIPITQTSVTENCEESQQPDTDTVLGKPSTTEGFTFPSLAAVTTTTTTTSGHGKKQVLNVVHEEYPIPPRHSLEVFQPAIITVDRDSSRESNNNNNRRRNMTSPPSPLSRDGDDAASDASSDLFEIESFSVQAVAALLSSPPPPPVTMAPNDNNNNNNNNKSSGVELRLATGAVSSGGSECSADKSTTIGGNSTK
ncbi:hypothetical protein PIB30_046717 [Stylosanthes scabra]|uniref:Uncharacterized protein n=1 Tax=Stylosanthes scabra TaxID=79078 RepID=A0ABU6YET2_9FABA|nr:hypothetical protein [Stylosanthes scabra]